MHGDEIRLVLPAEPAYRRIARIAAAGLALRLGLDRDQVEDLRIAVDETLILLLRPGADGDDAAITLTFTIGPDRLLIDAEGDSAGKCHGLDPDAVGRFEELVNDTVDVCAVAASHVHLEKARPARVP